MCIRYFSLPFLLKIEIKKCDAGEIVTLAYLVVCTLNKVLFSGVHLNQLYSTLNLNP